MIRRPLNILGLHLGHDASAAVIVEDRLVAMSEKERLTRKKYDSGFSAAMIDCALKEAGIDFRDVDFVACTEPTDGSVSLGREEGFDLFKYGKPYRSGPRHLRPWNCEGGIELHFRGIVRRAWQVQHHICHIASSYYLSNFSSAVGLSFDASGKPEAQTSLATLCEGNQMHVLGCPNMNSGIAYAAISDRLFGTWHDAGKVMGLAAYGKPRFYDDSAMVDRSIDGTYAFLHRSFPSVSAEAWRSSVGYDMAASVQLWLERDLSWALDFFARRYGNPNLVLSGGCALNVIGNRLALRRFPKLFIAPFCKDSGISAGSALYLTHHIFGRPRHAYATEDICFLGGGESRRQRPFNVEPIAKLLDEGGVVLWHQGRSEVGPRALTHRSIFGDPRSQAVKALVSEQIKGRESFRPLAPIVKAERCAEYFDINSQPLTDMMLLNAKVRAGPLAGVTHVDGTARVQTIRRAFNPEVWNLLDAFEHRTGLPVLINTSLNVGGQAICETPQDTLSAFESCKADMCVIDGEAWSH